MAGVPAVTVDASGVAVVSAYSLFGFSVSETGSAVAQVAVYAGEDANGTLLASVSLAADGAENAWFGPDGVAVDGESVFVEVVAGDVLVTVYAR